MKVRVTCFGALKEHLPARAGGHSAWADVGAGATVRDAAASLGLPERHLFAVLVNGARSNLHKKLQEGDEVTLMPPFSGG